MKENTATAAGECGIVLCYERFSRNVVRFLNYIVRDLDIAEELMHDTFLKVYEKGYPLDGNSSRSLNLLLTVARNRALDFLKRRRIESVKLREKQFQEVALDDSFYGDLERCYIRGEVLSTLQDVIASFPEALRGALRDRLYEGKRLCHVSAERGVSPYCIKKAEKALRSEMRLRFQENPEEA
ncbi:MAG: sigma-70 family RNA polymerase sigma factor [Spirochaetes bacterium]|nr:sigma-70 family RNA polymerase sigma factor [Spirochaetota bacterium]